MSSIAANEFVGFGATTDEPGAAKVAGAGKDGCFPVIWASFAAISALF